MGIGALRWIDSSLPAAAAKARLHDRNATLVACGAQFAAALGNLALERHGGEFRIHMQPLDEEGAQVTSEQAPSSCHLHLRRLDLRIVHADFVMQMRSGRPAGVAAT